MGSSLARTQLEKHNLIGIKIIMNKKTSDFDLKEDDNFSGNVKQNKKNK